MAVPIWAQAEGVFPRCLLLVCTQLIWLKSSVFASVKPGQPAHLSAVLPLRNRNQELLLAESCPLHLHGAFTAFIPAEPVLISAGEL